MDRELFNQLTDDVYLRKQRTRLGDEVFCATVQTWLENVVVDYLNLVFKKTGIDQICFQVGLLQISL